PQVAGIVVNDGTVQRSRVTSVTVNFDVPITLPSPPESAFHLARQSDNGAVGLIASLAGGTKTTTVTLTFTGSLTEFDSLADGRYTLTFLANQLQGAGGYLDGDGNGVGGDDYVVVGAPGVGPNLFRLFGDSNGDGDTDASDFLAFRDTILFVYNPAFDFDGDG